MQVGAQTYTIREYTQTEAGFRNAMRQLAQIGYRTVQLSAVGQIAPQTMREICDENGLTIVLTHTDPERMLVNPEDVIADHDVLGCRLIGIGSMPPRYRTAEGVRRFAADFMVPAKMMRDAGKRLMYHHHNFEWERINSEQNMLDVLLEDFAQDLMGITLDTYWVQAAGADVCDTITRLAERLDCVHLKDMAVKGFEQRMAAVGEGNLPFGKILKLLQRLGTTRYLLVEQDNCYGENPFDCLSRSYSNLKKEGYA